MEPTQHYPAPEVRTPPRVVRHSVGMYRTIATIFLLLTAVVAGLVAYVVLAHATVVVLSKQEPANADFVVDIAENPSGTELKGTVAQAEDSLTETFETSSVVKIDTAAEGKVRITSTLYRPQTLIATTRLLTPDGVLFRIRNTVTVPANGSVVADVYADQIGSAGNVGNTTFTIPGLNADSARFFTVTSEGAFAGGVRDQRMLTKADVDAAEASLRKRLEAALADKLRVEAQAAGTVPSGEFIDYEVVRKTTDVPIGDEKETFTLTLGLRATAVFYDDAAFDAHVRAHITDHLPYGRALLSIEEGSMETDVEKVDLVAGRANLHVTAKGVTVLSPESPALRKDKILGVTVDSAKRYLERIEGVSSASVTVRPFWMGRMPNVADHITIEVR